MAEPIEIIIRQGGSDGNALGTAGTGVGVGNGKGRSLAGFDSFSNKISQAEQMTTRQMLKGISIATTVAQTASTIVNDHTSYQSRLSGNYSRAEAQIRLTNSITSTATSFMTSAAGVKLLLGASTLGSAAVAGSLVMAKEGYTVIKSIINNALTKAIENVKTENDRQRAGYSTFSGSRGTLY